ncbi:restriction endonuclease subunit S [Treponema sp.]|uniref:restriction endonuclease subunit S n=1 Tax=Treponema sp. TaxID=166 RepID=UPI00388FA176
MTAKDLKNALLQEAVQGKLVPQIASEGNARDLLEEIRKEKAKLVKEGKIKKEKPLPEIIEEEIPFDIPDNWCWCKLGEIVNKLTDGTHRTPKYVEKGIPFLSVKNLSSGKMDFENSKFITLEEHKELYARCNPEKGDMLLTKVGTTGIPVINDSDIEFSLFVSVALIKFNHDFLDAKFLLYLLQSPLVQEQAKENTRGVGNKNWVMDAIANTILVLPPLDEQKRIVAAIEKFMPLIEEYGKKETELKAFNEQIGALTKKAILQEAVQGKLVPQIAAEGTAKDLLEEIKKEKAKLIKKGKIKKEKTLPEITEDEIPFDIPENWCWCRLGEIVNKLTDGTHRTPKYVEKGIPFLSVKNLSSGKMDFDNTKFITPEEHKELYARCNPEKGDMLLTKVGTTGIPVINDSDIEFSLFVSVALIKFNHDFLDPKFFLYLLQSPLVQDQAKENTRGVGNKNWVMDAIANTVLVLPPLIEQKRIVEAIEKMLPLCEKI